MKAIFVRLTLTAILCCAAGSMARADEYSEIMKTAQSFEDRGFADARSAYERAAKKANDDAERGRALLGFARTTQVRYAGYPESEAGQLKLQAYAQVLALPMLPPEMKIEALFGRAQTQSAIAKHEQALISLDQVLAVTGVTEAQKNQVALWRGEILLATQRYEPARAALNSVVESTDAAQKIAAHRLVARTYLAQQNINAARVEIAKINALPAQDAGARAEIHLQNAQIFSQSKQFATAREELGKIANLTNVPKEKSISARLQIGGAFYEEQQFAKAREIWQDVLAQPDGATEADRLWQLMALSWIAEQKFPEARQAIAKRIELPNSDVQTKMKGWLDIASTFAAEKDYAKARETLDKITTLLPATHPSHVELQLIRLKEVAATHRLENNFDAARLNYTQMLQLTPNLPPLPNGLRTEPAYINETRRAVKLAADEMALDKRSMDAAFSLYSELERFWIYDKEKAEANLGMGDIRVAQGNKADAKQFYENALKLRKNFDEGKLAQQKLAQLGN